MFLAYTGENCSRLKLLGNLTCNTPVSLYIGMRQLVGEEVAYLGWRSSVVRESWWWKDVCLIIALKVTCLKVQYAEVRIDISVTLKPIQFV